MKSNPAYCPPAYSPPRVLFKDEFLLAVEKPAGLLSVPGRGPDKSDCLSARVQQTFPEARIVHRLDMETSGLVLFARDEAMQRLLGQLFEQRKIDKTYVAIVHGNPDPDSGLIDVPLIADWPNRPLQKVDYVNGKPSQTGFSVLSRDAERDQGRLQLKPYTGRSHQLRVHLHYIGHPIVGDRLYRNPDTPHRADRLMLHATELAFAHPQTEEWLTISCPASF